MKKQVIETTTVQTTRPDEGGITRFEIRHVGDITKALDELRRCIKLWSRTPEGLASYQNSSEDYNWGDFLDDLDCEKLQIGKQYPVKFKRNIIKGITWEDVIGDFQIEHDEQLMREEW